jgi:hypothetical protein
MSLNDFARQVTVAFEEEIFPEFEDRLILSSKVTVNQEDGKQMERSGDVVWRPMPMIATSNDGMDASNNFKEITDLVVPATLGFQKHVARAMDAKELRDDLRKKRFGKAAAVRLASDINIAGMDTLCNQATLIDTKTSAAAGYADPARLDSLCNRNGIPQAGRQLAYCSPDYNGMADNLAGRGTLSGKPLAAYEKGLIGEDVAGFMAHKLDYANICNAAAGSGITMDTRASATNYWVPKAKRVSATGELANVDNRYQQITVSSTTNVLAGDWFTIAGVYEAHKITKRTTGNLKQFRVISKESSTLLTISPPIISAQGASQAELDYQNCIVATEASNSALVWLNTAAKPINPFWIEGAVELLPGRYEVPEGAGVEMARATTKQGVDLVMVGNFNHRTFRYEFRWDVFFGWCVLQPEMVGGQLFNQT